jgi:hypothetical protein
MAITKIDDIYLYTDLSWDPSEVSESVDAKAFLDACGLTYIHLNYADPEQHPFVFDPLSSWSFSDGSHKIETFPFVIYTEIHDDLSPAKYPKVLLYGLDEIENSNLTELYQLGR